MEGVITWLKAQWRDRFRSNLHNELCVFASHIKPANATILIILCKLNEKGKIKNQKNIYSYSES